MPRHFHTWRCLYYRAQKELRCRKQDGLLLLKDGMPHRTKLGGKALLAMWLTPGVPPPGPFG